MKTLVLGSILSLATLGPALASGGGTGGGGGGGGGGGVKLGSIVNTAASVTCDDGTVLVVDLGKGSGNALLVTITVVSAVASPASGFLEVSLLDEASGASVLSFGQWPGSWVAGLSEKVSGRSLPVGTYTLDFTAIVHDGTDATGPALQSCFVSFPATFR